MTSWDFPVVIEYDAAENVYLADSPVLPGCYTDGKTRQEAIANIRDAIKLMVESRRAVGDPIPIFEIVHVAA